MTELWSVPALGHPGHRIISLHRNLIRWQLALDEAKDLLPFWWHICQAVQSGLQIEYSAPRLTSMFAVNNDASQPVRSRDVELKWLTLPCEA